MAYFMNPSMKFQRVLHWNECFCSKTLSSQIVPPPVHGQPRNLMALAAKWVQAFSDESARSARAIS